MQHGPHRNPSPASSGVGAPARWGRQHRTASAVSREPDIAELVRTCQRAEEPDSGVEPEAAGEAWGELHAHFHPRIAAFCRRALPGDDGEDLASEIMLKARFRIASFDGVRPFAPWLFRIAANRCWDEARRTRRSEPLDDDDAARLTADTRSPLDLLLTRETRDQVRAALDELPRRQRFALTLRYQAELSYREIGEALGIPATQVGVLLLRGRRRMRTLLADAPGGGPVAGGSAR